MNRDITTPFVCVQLGVRCLTFLQLIWGYLRRLPVRGLQLKLSHPPGLYNGRYNEGYLPSLEVGSPEQPGLLEVYQFRGAYICCKAHS